MGDWRTKMNVAIIGSSGYIAGYIKNNLLSSDLMINILSLDCTSESDIFLDLNKPTEFAYNILQTVSYVIFTAAVSSPDKCAADFEKCWKINVVGTEYFIQKALENGCKVLFFSSDAVFGEFSEEIAYENTMTKAASAYGYMKKHVEDHFRGEKDFKAIRLSYVISSKDRFTTYCLNCIQKKKVVEIYHPFYRNCVSVHDVVNVIIWLLKQWDRLPSQFLNIAGTELVSRIQIADELNCLMNNQLKYSILNPGEEFFKNRARITHMGSLYLYELDILQRRTFFELLKEEIKEIKDRRE